MLRQSIYEKGVVTFKKAIKGFDKNTTFKKHEIDVIDKIDYTLKDGTDGIIIYFNSGKILINNGVTNHNRWLKKHLKLTI